MATNNPFEDPLASPEVPVEVPRQVDNEIFSTAERSPSRQSIRSALKPSSRSSSRGVSPEAWTPNDAWLDDEALRCLQHIKACSHYCKKFSHVNALQPYVDIFNKWRQHPNLKEVVRAAPNMFFESLPKKSTLEAITQQHLGVLPSAPPYPGVIGSVNIADVRRLMDQVFKEKLKNDKMPHHVGPLLVEPPSNWPARADGSLIIDTTKELSPKEQNHRHSTVAGIFQGYRKKFFPPNKQNPDRRAEDIVDFLRWVNQAQRAAGLSETEFRENLPNLFGSIAAQKIHDMIQNKYSLREIYRNLIKSYTLTESPSVALDKLSKISSDNHDSLMSLTDEVYRLANIVASEKLTDTGRQTAKNEAVINAISRNVPRDWKVPLERDIMEFRQNVGLREIDCDEFLRLLRKYELGLDTHFHRHCGKSKKIVSKVVVASSQSTTKTFEPVVQHPNVSHDSVNQLNTSTTKPNQFRNNTRYTGYQQPKQGNGQHYNNTNTSKFNKNKNNNANDGSKTYCPFCNSKTHNPTECTTFSPAQRTMTQERCSKCTLGGFHQERHCPVIRLGVRNKNFESGKNNSSKNSNNLSNK